MQMVKKVLRWIAMASPIIFLLPLCLKAWNIASKVNGETFKNAEFAEGIFGNTENAELAFKMVDKEFAKVWLVLFAVFAVIALVLSVAVTVLYILNDLHVLKLQSCEKFLSLALLCATVLGTLFALVALIANAYSTTRGSFSMSLNLVALGAVWVFIVGGLVMSALAVATAKWRK